MDQKKAIILARVSTDEQDSNEAQSQRLKSFAESKGFSFFEVHEIAESSTKEDRAKFQEIIQNISKSKVTCYLFVDTIDRLQRSFRESTILDDLRKQGKVELHFYRENLVINANSNSADIIRWDMGVLFAKSYVLQLSDNVKRRFEQKRKNGEFTGTAPFGYKSQTADEKKRLRSDILVNPDTASYVVNVFEMYASGGHSVASIRNWLNDEGVKTNTGKKFTTSSVHQMLRNPFYYGEVHSKYGIYEHRYETLVSRKMYSLVQSKLAERNKNPVHQVRKREFIFSNLLKCKHCGCTMTAEIKKNKYVYYSCTNGKGTCKRVYTNENEFLKPVREVLSNIKLSDEQIQQIVTYLKESHQNQSRYHKEQVKSLQRKYDTCQVKLDRLLDLLIDGNISQDAYEQKQTELTLKQKDLNCKLDELTNANESYHITAKTVLSLAQRALELFESSEVPQKRQLLSFLLQNSVVDGKNLEFELRKPFDTMLDVKGYPILLRGQDSNL